jgi:hypothetical protein
MNKKENKKLSIQSILGSDIDSKASVIYYIVKASQPASNTSESLYLVCVPIVPNSDHWHLSLLHSLYSFTELLLPQLQPVSAPKWQPSSISRTSPSWLLVSPSAELFACFHDSQLYGTCRLISVSCLQIKEGLKTTLSLGACRPIASHKPKFLWMPASPECYVLFDRRSLQLYRFCRHSMACELLFSIELEFVPYPLTSTTMPASPVSPSASRPR